MMKRIAIAAALAALAFIGLTAGENGAMTVGVHALAGYRYDDLRMCVGSPAGVKGGPIGDIYVDLRFPLGTNDTLAVNIPVFRPILLGAAFSMLQFEPQATYEHRFGTAGAAQPLLGAGLGAVFHYGPDYNSTPDNPGESFFAAGPLFSLSFGVLIPSGSGGWTPGIKAFTSPLFGEEGRRGLVAGGALELHWAPGKKQ
jgi:hypothetical protein